MTKYERGTIPVTAIYYPAIFLVCGPLQAFNWRVPFLCYAILVADIFVYINYADSLVSVDPLTKISNRNGLVQFLTHKLIDENENPEDLYLFAIDVNDLNSVNTLYGRSEGDRVLILMADALQKFKDEEHDCYIARYFGDEFMIVANIQDNDEFELFIEHIRNYINNMAMSENLAYRLRVNIGWAKYEKYSRTETISGLIEEADKILNEKKEQRKFQTIWKNN